MKVVWLLGLLATACASAAPSPGKSVDPFADAVVSFKPGANAGFGATKMPDVVLGPPHGNGDQAGSLDVVSLGKEGELILRFDDIGVVDGPGIDFLVFENPFSTWIETGRVAVSDDGVNFVEFPCDLTTTVGCAGVHPVFSDVGKDISPTDPSKAGGDGFDLSTIGVKSARFVRIRDTGFNSYEGISGGFDLDALAVVNGNTL